jgi:hypothetical protein
LNKRTSRARTWTKARTFLVQSWKHFFINSWKHVGT